MAVFPGWKKYVVTAAESAWGTTPGSPTYIYVPVKDYTVRSRPIIVTPEQYTGFRQRRHQRITGHSIDGTMDMNLLSYHVSSKSIAQRMLEYCFDSPSGQDLASFLAEPYDVDIDNKRHNGLRVDTATIAGQEGGIITLTMGLKGKTETGGITAQALSATAPQPVEFLFKDVSFSIGGVAATICDFNLTIMNNLIVKYCNSDTPTFIVAGERHVDFSFGLYKTDNTFDALNRSTSIPNTTMQLVLTGSHNGTGATGTNTTITFDFDRANFGDADGSGALSDLWKMSNKYMILKPSTSDNDVDITYGLA